MISPLQFHFQFDFGYELKTVFCSSWIAKESVAIQTGCRKDVNQIEGTSWPEPLKMIPNTFALIQVMKIFGKYLYISNVKFTMKGCRDKIVVFWLFSKEDPKFLHAKFQVYLTSPSGFFTDKSKKYTQYLTFSTKKTICHKIWVILHHPKKVWT